MWACCPRGRFYGRGTACTAAASCSRPRTVSGRHGGAVCGRQPLRQHTVRSAGTQRTTDAGEEKPLMLSAICGHTLGTLLIWFLPDAGNCERHSTSCLSVPTWDSQDEHMGGLAFAACAAPPSACIGSYTSRLPARRPFCTASPSPPGTEKTPGDLLPRGRSFTI